MEQENRSLSRDELSKQLSWILSLSLLFGATLLFVNMFAVEKPMLTAHDYLPVHTLLEFLSIIVVGMVFALSWSLRHQGDSRYMLLGMGLLVVGLIDFAHLLSFTGMPDMVTPSGVEKAINFWLAGRFLLVFFLLGVALMAPVIWSLRVYYSVVAMGICLAALIWWVGLWQVEWLPHTFEEGQGLTTFKIYSEYLLALLYGTASILLYLKSRRRGNPGLQWLAVSAWVLGLAELFFSLYSNATDIYNLMGHIYKAIAYLMIYRGIFTAGIQIPYRELELAQSRQQVLLASIPDPIWLKDSHYRFLSCNRQFERLIGMEEMEIKGKKASEVAGGNQLNFIWMNDTGTVEKGRTLSEEWLTFSKGDYCGLFEVSRIPMFGSGGELIGVLGIAHDITDRKQAELAITRDQAQLEQLVEERTAELNQARDVAESANRAKSIFLANMSHELRTPLNAILGFSDILRRDTQLSEDQKSTLETIHRSGDHLLCIINDVLEISKIEAGRVVLESTAFDLGRMINDVTEMLMVRIRKKGLELRLEQAPGFPRYIVGDEGKLRQVLVNLITNAIKATEQGDITLRMGLKHNRADHLLIEVEDSGTGIAPEDKGMVFEDFVQVGAQGQQQGTGLGLPIVRHFVELMGGSLSLDSTLGEGSTFRIDMPTQLVNPDELAETTKLRSNVIGLAPGQPTFRILVVEDQLVNQQVLSFLLEKTGFDVEIACNGVEAVEKFTCWNPHFIWMDRRMPVMDGVEATRRIRALPGGDTVKIAAVTASTFTEETEELMAAGFDAVMHKPYRYEEVFQWMEQLLGIHFIFDMAEAQPLPELSPVDFALIPDPLRQELAQALLMLDEEYILEVIHTIAQTAPELGAALKEKAKNYDYQPILALLQSRES